MSVAIPSVHVPFLPGHSVHDLTRQQHPRPQTLVYKLESAAENLEPQHAPVPAELLQLMRDRADWRLDKTKPQMTHEERAAVRERQRNATLPAQQPAWLKHDRQVLRFFAYFQEPVHESARENARVRNCIINLYLEDGTMQVSEPKVTNSGLPQGSLVKRHRIPRGDGRPGFLGVEDLKLGTSISIYARSFRLVSCDQFSRWFLEQAGLEVGEEEDTPLDAFFEMEIWKKESQLIKTGYPREVMQSKEYNELSLGGHRRNAKLQQYIENDGKVLRFYAYWDDPTRYGTRQYYVVHFFLADDTVEINERYARNAGRDPYPVFFKRSALHKLPSQTHAPAMLEPVKEAYKPQDLQVGSSMSVYGRLFLLYDCDDFTRNFYEQYMGYCGEKITIPEEPLQHVQLRYPPHIGIGSEADSLGSCVWLRPRPPKTDLVKLLTNAEKVLRYEAVMDTVADESRKFIIGVYLADDSTCVWEQRQRNSGQLEGKYAERSVRKNPATGKTFNPMDFYVGASVKISGADFMIVRADEYTLKYMESVPEEFPMCDIGQVAHGLKGLTDAPALQGVDSMAPDKLRDIVLQHLQVRLVDQELITILRSCGDEDTASVLVPRLMQVIDAVSGQGQGQGPMGATQGPDGTAF